MDIYDCVKIGLEDFLFLFCDLITASGIEQTITDLANAIMNGKKKQLIVGGRVRTVFTFNSIEYSTENYYGIKLEDLLKYNNLFIPTTGFKIIIINRRIFLGRPMGLNIKTDSIIDLPSLKENKLDNGLIAILQKFI